MNALDILVHKSLERFELQVSDRQPTTHGKSFICGKIIIHIHKFHGAVTGGDIVSIFVNNYGSHQEYLGELSNIMLCERVLSAAEKVEKEVITNIQQTLINSLLEEMK